MIVYCAGKYRAATPELVALNVRKAEDLAAAVLAQGIAVYCPHSMTHEWERYDTLDDDKFLFNGLEILKVCDAVLLIPGYETSQGTLAEIDCAEEYGIPVFKTIRKLLQYCRAFSAGVE